MLTVRGQQHSFSHTNGCSCESVSNLETENVSILRGIELPTFGFMPNTLATWAIKTSHLLLLDSGSGGIDILFK